MKRKLFTIVLGVAGLSLGLYILLQYFLPVSLITSGINAKKYGRACEYSGQCGDIVAINCRAEVDGPFYYVNKNSGEIIEYCGGYCMGGDPTGKYCKNCPPKDWNCK